MKLKSFKISAKHKAFLKDHVIALISAIVIMAALLIGIGYKRSMRADGDSTARGAFWGGVSGAALGGAIGGGRGAAIGAGVGLGTGALIGSSSSRSRYDEVNPETKRLNNIYKQMDRKQAKLDKINNRLARAKENRRQSLMRQAEQYQREIADLQNQADAIINPPRRSHRRNMPMNNRYNRYE